MPFGLTNSPAIFQHLMNDIFREFLDKFVVCYLDDILIYSKDIKQDEEHIQLVLNKLRNTDLYAKLEKCNFHQSQVEFFGYIVSCDGKSIDQKIFRQFWDGQHQKRYMMSNASLDLQISIESSSKTIPKL